MIYPELAGKTWGIIGMGAIGRKVAEIATVFGCKVITYSASGKTYDLPYPQVDFDTLLTSSDIVSVHAEKARVDVRRRVPFGVPDVEPRS